ncbi:MAG: cellulose-binding protein [Agarilytica sp.]
MNSHILVSVISDDKPGVVEAIAESISKLGGNWLESKLSQLSGKFAGVIRVSIAAESRRELETALFALESQGIWVKCEQLSDSKETRASQQAYVHVLGPDRPGIVRELSKALVQRDINLAELETSLSSMPYSGDPLFEAKGVLQIPEASELSDLHTSLDEIADNLALDISLSETQTEP